MGQMLGKATCRLVSLSLFFFFFLLLGVLFPPFLLSLMRLSCLYDAFNISDTNLRKTQSDPY